MKYFFTILFAATSIGSFAQLARGTRTLAIQPDIGETTTYDEVIQQSQGLCYETVHLSIPWSYIEEDNGVWNSGNIAAYLDIANSYYPSYGLSIELNISGINTVNLSMPEDLKTVNWNSQTMINRYKTFLDTVFNHMPDVDITLLNIGNEIDIYYGDNITAYNEYKTFFDSVKPYAEYLYAQTHVTDLDVGCTMTLSGLTDPTLGSQCALVNASADIISTTYYPLNPDFTMSNVNSAIADFNLLISAYPGSKQIYFAECGYSSSSDCNSTEQKQADFYTNVFTAWDTHIDRIPTITIFKIIDWSETQAQDLADEYGLGTDNKFKEYLRTLGIREYNGTSERKEAYYRLECELNSRGWCNSVFCQTNVDENSEKSFSIYPNPTSDYINIKGNLNDIKTVFVLDDEGRIVHEQFGGNPVDVRNYNSGIYWVQMNYVGGVLYEKLIIQ